MNDRNKNSEATQVESSPRVELRTGSEAETLAFGTALAHWMQAGDVVLLHGDLGAGKTVFARGIARGLGVETPVTSPSFALVNEYALPPDSPLSFLFHLDLYRLVTLDDLETIGFSDITATPTGIAIVEWPERALGALPDRYLLVEISSRGEGVREFAISGSPTDTEWHVRLTDLHRILHVSYGAGIPQ